MTKAELEKRNAQLGARIGVLADKIGYLENEISKFKTRVTADMKRLITIVENSRGGQ